jgi:multicomponent Na+:H+ antiporter subunit B
MRRFIPVVLFCIFGIIMIAAVLTLAPVGDPHQPSYAEFVPPDVTYEEIFKDGQTVALHYNRNGAFDTGSLDIITSTIFDYRGYDTLFETTVLFTALISVLTVIGIPKD